jgi:hypothetical protein
LVERIRNAERLDPQPSDRKIRAAVLVTLRPQGIGAAGQLQKQATREKLMVLLVNWKQGHSESLQIKKIFKNLSTDITLISDEHSRDADAYGVKGIPYMAS